MMIVWINVGSLVCFIFGFGGLSWCWWFYSVLAVCGFGGVSPHSPIHCFAILVTVAELSQGVILKSI